MSKNGFTLIEVLVVVIIVGILSAVAVPQYRKAMDRAKAAEAMQMLPALFEARERWMIEHLCRWQSEEGDDDSYTCQGGETLTSINQLDIETKMRSQLESGVGVVTKNFSYSLFNGTPEGSNQMCVSAVPMWGENRGLTSSVIYYRGDKFACTDTEGGKAGCSVLSVDDGSGANGCE